MNPGGLSPAQAGAMFRRQKRKLGRRLEMTERCVGVMEALFEKNNLSPTALPDLVEQVYQELVNQGHLQTLEDNFSAEEVKATLLLAMAGRNELDSMREMIYGIIAVQLQQLKLAQVEGKEEMMDIDAAIQNTESPIVNPSHIRGSRL